MSVRLWMAAAFAVMTAGALAAPAEFRACYINRFQWPNQDRASCEATIRTMMQTLADHNFNAVLFQIRGECDVNYPSPDEPWGPAWDYTDPGWDPVAFAIGEAHSRGLEFIAYINTHTLVPARGLDQVPEHTSPEHPYNLHGRAGVQDSWVICGEDGQPALHTSEYVWMSPGIPEASAWTRRQILYVVNHCDIDGLTFDRIRTPGEQYSHDPVTEARFHGAGNPASLEWGDFMRAQITDDLERIYGAVNEVKPNVVITASPFGINRRLPGGYQGNGTQSYYQHYQDSFTWMERHVLDMEFPMIYWGIGSAHPFEVLFHDFMQHTGGRHMSVAFNRSDPEEVVAQIEEVRRQGGVGTAYWVYGRTPWSTFDRVYAEPAPIPERTWKTHPTTGIVIGNVLSLRGEPFVDAHVRLDDQMRLSAGDGFFAFLDVPPGRHHLSVELPPHDHYPGSTLAGDIEVAAGQVVRQDLRHRGGLVVR
jgi:uncharacterized lipoprotein YddW (UPF0748 family)